MTSHEDIRGDLLKIFMASLSQVSGRESVRATLQQTGSPCSVLAIGKAAESMLLGALDVRGADIVDGLLISKAGHFDTLQAQYPNIECLEGAHPVPDERSLLAGQRLLHYLAEIPADRPLLVLISGGASSLVEVLPESVGLDQLQELNGWLLANGLPIDAMNRVRSAISLIKRGGLIPHMGTRPVELLLISDVPGDDPVSVGSGLLVAENEIALPVGLPDWILSMMPEKEKNKRPQRDEITPRIVASLTIARQAAAQQAQTLGYSVNLSHAHIGGDVDVVGRRLALELNEGWPGLYIWGGEPVVNLPANPGRGGRNQHLALTVAKMISGRDDVLFLSAGTDGGDGPGVDAGALVDGGTLRRGRGEGISIETCLQQADSGRFLAASGDLINTGPTGTNVMDLMLGLKLR